MCLILLLMFALLSLSYAQTQTVTICETYPFTITFTEYSTVYQTVNETTFVSQTSPTNDAISFTRTSSTTTLSVDSTTSVTTPLETSLTTVSTSTVQTTTSTSTVSPTPSIPDQLYIRILTNSSVAWRDVSYVGFSGGKGIAVSGLDSAALVTLDTAGRLAFNSTLIGPGDDNILSLLSVQKADDSSWQKDEATALTLSGSYGFCTRQDGYVIVLLEPGSQDGCIPVTLYVEVPSTSSSTTTSTSSSVTTTEAQVTSTQSTTISTSPSVLTTSMSTTTTFVQSSSTTTTSDGLCAVTNPALLSVQNADIDRSNVASLNPKKVAILNYREVSPGKNALSVELSLLYDAVLLEDSAYVQAVTCSAGTVTIEFTGQQAFEIGNQWSSTLLLITDSSSCNTPTARGVFLASSHSAGPNANSLVFAVIEKEWPAVADYAKVSYGIVQTGTSGAEAIYDSTCTSDFPDISTSTTSSTEVVTTTSQSSSTTEQSSTITTSETTTSSTTTSQTTTTSATPSLSPGSKEMIGVFEKSFKRDPDNNLVFTQHPKEAEPKSITVEGLNDDPEYQKALEDKLQGLGLSPPDALFAEADRAAPTPSTSQPGVIPDVCPARNDQPAQRPMIQDSKPKRTVVWERSVSPNPAEISRRELQRRLSDEDMWEIVCGDIGEFFSGFFEVTEAIQQLVCAGKSLYDSRDALRCLFSFRPYCEITVTITFPPATKYDYTATYSGSVGLRGGIYSNSAGTRVKCIDCSLSFSEIKLVGAMQFNLSVPRIDFAYNTLTMNLVQNVNLGLDTVGADAGNFTKALSNLELQALTVDKMFTIDPTMIFSIGLLWDASTAVSTSGGVQLTLNGATGYMDFTSGASSALANWTPSKQVAYPLFSSDAKVKFRPIVRASINFDVNIYGGYIKTSAAVTSENVINFDTEYNRLQTSYCPADRLAVKSYVRTKNSLFFGATGEQILDQKTLDNPVQCYQVPDVLPDTSAVFAFNADPSGPEFCTSYLNYQPSATTVNTAATKNTDTTAIATVTNTIAITTTSYVTSPTVITQTAIFSMPSFTTVYVGGGSQSLAAPVAKRTLGFEARNLAPRAVPTPAAGATWNARQLSYACSQIATGVTTKLVYSTTLTSITGTVTSTSTRDVAANGPLESVTEYSYSWLLATVSTRLIPGSTKTLTHTTGCPLETQAACFKIKGHGDHPLADGKYLGLESYQDSYRGSSGNAAFGVGRLNPELIFRLDNRRLVTQPEGLFAADWKCLPHPAHDEWGIGFLAPDDHWWIEQNPNSAQWQYSDCSYFWDTHAINEISCSVDCSGSAQANCESGLANGFYMNDVLSTYSPWIDNYEGSEGQYLDYSFAFNPKIRPDPFGNGRTRYRQIYVTFEPVTCPCAF